MSQRSKSPTSILENIDQTGNSSFNKIKNFVETIDDSLDQMPHEGCVKILKTCIYHVYQKNQHHTLATCLNAIITDQNKSEQGTKLYNYFESMVFVMLIDSLRQVDAEPNHIQQIKPKLNASIENFKNC